MAQSGKRLLSAQAVTLASWVVPPSGALLRAGSASLSSSARCSPPTCSWFLSQINKIFIKSKIQIFSKIYPNVGLDFTTPRSRVLSQPGALIF